MAYKQKKILFFHYGANPPEEIVEKCVEIGGLMRNAEKIRPGEKPEDCDAVAGVKIPDIYRDFDRITLNDPDAAKKAAASAEKTDSPPQEEKKTPVTKADKK